MCLTCALCRIFEKLLSAELEKHVLTKINNCQHWFRKHRGTLTNQLEFYAEVHAILDKQKYYDVILLNLSKAFEKIPHSLLYKKLAQINIPENLLLIFKNFLTFRKQLVIFSDQKSSLIGHQWSTTGYNFRPASLYHICKRFV